MNPRSLLLGLCVVACSDESLLKARAPVIDAGADVAPPPTQELRDPIGCDGEPKDEPCLVANPTSIFVNPSGNDDSPGTREAPMRTLTKAVARAIEQLKLRVIVCEGTYEDTINITPRAKPLGIYGGFACKDWSYSGVLPRISPQKGLVFDAQGVEETIKLQDVELVAAPGTEDQKQSVAMRLRKTAALRMKRVKIKTGKGFTPKKPMPLTNQIQNLSGDPTGTAKACTCPRFGASIGGGSGAPGATEPFRSLPGNAGTTCNGGDGVHGQAGDGGLGARTMGIFDGDKFIEDDGLPGKDGSPGQGGGGGANGGGGGGCGSCGGGPGAGGIGGGSSIGILASDSALILEQCEIEIGGGAAGGPGGDGEEVILGGVGGVATCSGGRGGSGAGGGGGGGGAGGSSIGIVYAADSPPLIDGVSVQSAGIHPLTKWDKAGPGGAGGQGGKALVPGKGGLTGSYGVGAAVFAFR